jgi:cytochrome c553
MNRVNILTIYHGVLLMRILAIISLLMLTLNVQAGDAAKGKKLYKKINCAQCHGKKGLGKAKMKKGKWKLNPVKGPQIAGLDAAYIVEQLEAVKSGARKTKYTSSMKAKIKKYSKEDFENLAAYISKEINPKAPAVKGMLQK